MSQIVVKPFNKNFVSSLTFKAPEKIIINNEVNYKISIAGNAAGANPVTKLPALFTLGVNKSKLFSGESVNLSLTSSDGSQTKDEKAAQQFFEEFLQRCKEEIAKAAPELKDVNPVTEVELSELTLFHTSEKGYTTVQLKLIPGGTYKTRLIDEEKKQISTSSLYIDKEQKKYFPSHMTAYVRFNHIWITPSKISINMTIPDAMVVPKEEERVQLTF